MDMQNFDAIPGDAIENLVWISNDGNDTNSRSPLDPPRTFRPPLKPFDYGPDAKFNRVDKAGIICRGMSQQIVQVGQCCRREDDFHFGRYFANVSSTSCSVANFPAMASLKPRSIPRSSSGVARY